MPTSENDRLEVVNSTTIRVNLDAPPKLPFVGAIVKSNTGSGWVTIKKHAGDLYQDGVLMVFDHLDNGQKNGKRIQGYELRTALEGRTSVHPNVMDALVERGWMPKACEGKWVFSFAVVYSNAPGHLYVRDWCRGDGMWRTSYDWLYGGWSSRRTSALLAN
jgi:hypothetical protein